MSTELEPPAELTVYRNRFVLLAMLAGCLFFLASLLLDRLGLFTLGWFQHASIVSHVFLAFLAMSAVWLTYLITQSNRPVISLRSTEVTFSNVHRPDSFAAIPYTRIREVSVSGESDSVPNYLVLQLDDLEEAEKRCPVWARILGNQIYFECSNLTSLPGEIRSHIEARIFQVKLDSE